MIKEIAFTVYPATDVKKLADFYSNVLGLNLTYKMEEGGKLQYAEFTVGNGYFGVMPGEWMEREAGSASGIGFEVENMDAWLAELETKGVKTEKPYDTPVCRISSILDPEGNKVTFHQATVAH